MRPAAPPGSPHASDYNATAHHTAADAQARPAVPYPTRELLRQDRENRDFVYNLGFAVSVLEDMLLKFETTTRARLSELNNKAARLERLLTYVEFFVSGGAPADAELPFPTPPASPVASVQQQLSASNSPRLGVPGAASGSRAYAEAETQDIVPPRDSSPRKATSSPRLPREGPDRGKSKSRSARSPRTKSPTRSPTRESHHRVHSTSPHRRVLPDEDPSHSSRNHSRSRGRRDDLQDSRDMDAGRKADRRTSPSKIRDSFTVNSSFQDWRPPNVGGAAAVDEAQVALRSSRQDELVNMDSDEEDSFDTQPVPPQVAAPDSPSGPAIQWSRTMDNALYESLALANRASMSSSVAWHAAPRPTFQSVVTRPDTPDGEEEIVESTYAATVAEQVGTVQHTTSSTLHSDASASARHAPNSQAGAQEEVGELAGTISRSFYPQPDARSADPGHRTPPVPHAMRVQEEDDGGEDEDLDMQYGTGSLPATAEHAAPGTTHAPQLSPQRQDVSATGARTASADVWKANLRQIEQQLSGVDLQSNDLGSRTAPTLSVSGHPTPPAAAVNGPVAPEATKPPMPRPGHRVSFYGGLQALPEETADDTELEHDFDAGVHATGASPAAGYHYTQDYDASPLASQSSPIDPEGRSLPDTDVASACNTPSGAYTYSMPRSRGNHQGYDDGMFEYGDFMLPLPHFLDGPSPAASLSHGATPRSHFEPGENDTPGAGYVKDQHVKWQTSHTGDTYSARSVGSVPAPGGGDQFLDEHLHRFSHYVPELPKADDYPWDTEASLSSPAPRVRAPLTASQGG